MELRSLLRDSFPTTLHALPWASPGTCFQVWEASSPVPQVFPLQATCLPLPSVSPPPWVTRFRVPPATALRLPCHPQTFLGGGVQGVRPRHSPHPPRSGHLTDSAFLFGICFVSPELAMLSANRHRLGACSAAAAERGPSHSALCPPSTSGAHYSPWEWVGAKEMFVEVGWKLGEEMIIM